MSGDKTQPLDLDDLLEKVARGKLDKRDLIEVIRYAVHTCEALSAEIKRLRANPVVKAGLTTDPAAFRSPTLAPQGLPEWFAKPQKHPDFVDISYDDHEAVISWQAQHIDMLEKLVKSLAAERERGGEGQPENKKKRGQRGDNFNIGAYIESETED